MPSILLKFSDQKTGSRRVVGWHKKSEKYFGFILPIKPRLRWVPEVYAKNGDFGTLKNPSPLVVEFQTKLDFKL